MICSNRFICVSMILVLYVKAMELELCRVVREKTGDKKMASLARNSLMTDLGLSPFGKILNG